MMPVMICEEVRERVGREEVVDLRFLSGRLGRLSLLPYDLSPVIHSIFY